VPIQILLPEELIFGTVYAHRLSSTVTETELWLENGQRIVGSQVHGVYNRLLEIPPEYLDRVIESDRDYVEHEFHAFLSSWISSLACPVLNSPSAFHLFGEWYHLSEWLAMARRVGFLITPYAASDQHEAELSLVGGESAHHGKVTVLVVGRQVICPDAPDAIVQQCRDLALLAGTQVLGVDFVVTPRGDWLLSGATPFPDLRPGGEQALAALAEALTEHG
jgi:hypothetical protein